MHRASPSSLRTTSAEPLLRVPAVQMSLPVTFLSFLLQPWECMAGSLKKPRYTTNLSPTHWLSTAYLCNPLFLLSNSLLTTRIWQHYSVVTSTMTTTDWDFRLASRLFLGLALMKEAIMLERPNVFVYCRGH